MTENFEIVGSFIKDMSSETPDAQTFVIVREKIANYQLKIDINSKAVKDGVIVKVNKEVTDKKEMEKIILCDVPNKIYPNLERIFINLLADSGYPGIKFEKKIDFTELYKKKSN